MYTHILLVDDEDIVRESIGDYLRNRGFHVNLANSGQEALKLAHSTTIDLMILDVHMPIMDGLDVCRAVRQLQEYILVLMISGERKEVIDRVVGLEVGADKYLLKPFELPELLAEINSLLRTRASSQRSTNQTSYLYQDSYLRIDTNQHEVSAGNAVHKLTTLEFELLCYLIDRIEQSCSRDDLIEHVWQDTNGAVSDTAVTSCVKRLRKKIEPDPHTPTYIKSEHGWGYKFCSLVE